MTATGREIVKEFLGEGDRFTTLVNDLLAAQAQALAVGGLHLNSASNLGDGGVDAKVDGVNPDDTLGWFIIPSIWQFKAVKSNPNLLNNIKKEMSQGYARRCVEDGFGYVLAVCDCLTQQKQDKWQTALTATARQINPGAPPVRVVTADDLALAMRRYPANGQELAATRASYLAYVQASYRYIDLRGFLPGPPVLLDMDAAFFPLRLELVTTIESDQPGQQVDSLVDGLLYPHQQIRSFSHTDAALREHSRIVILGDPGSGKTTLLRYLAYQQAGVGGSLPIYLRVAEYAEAISRDRQLPLLDFLTKLLL